MPKVSFLCPSYNHEKYVRVFLESVLAQTDPSWELVIVDDCSTDGNVGVIEAFPDPRIRLVRHEFNQGINGALMTAFEHSVADLIVMVDSDDMVLPDCVERLTRAFADSAVDVVASSMKHMDADGVLQGNRHPLPVEWSRERLFFEMAFSQNMLPWPGLAMRRYVLAEVMPLDLGILNYQDWLVNLRLVHDYNVLLSNSPVVVYRRGHSGNVDDFASPAVVFRESAEMFRLMDEVVNLIGTSPDEFVRWIGPCPETARQSVESRDIPFLIGMIAVRSKDPSRRRWGLCRLQRCLSDREAAHRLFSRYKFDYAKFLALSKPPDGTSAQNPMAAENAQMHRLRRKVWRYKALAAVFGIVALAVVLLAFA